MEKKRKERKKKKKKKKKLLGTNLCKVLIYLGTEFTHITPKEKKEKIKKITTAEGSKRPREILNENDKRSPKDQRPLSNYRIQFQTVYKNQRSKPNSLQTITCVWPVKIQTFPKF